VTGLQALKQSKDAKHNPDLLPVYTATYGIILMGVPHRGISWVPLVKDVSAPALGDSEIVRALDQRNAGSIEDRICVATHGWHIQDSHIS
jgi:hypothetical protein